MWIHFFSSFYREQKILLLPKKKRSLAEPKKIRTPASQKKDKKFQLKVSCTLKDDKKF